jgi:hypothetical protein
MGQVMAEVLRGVPSACRELCTHSLLLTRIHTLDLPIVLHGHDG